MFLSPSRFSIILGAIVLAVLLLPLSLTAAPRDAATAWVVEHAFPIVSTDPDAPFDDLECLRDLIGDARIVALGEQTHGTHEFQTMKHRIVRFLFEEMGFTVLGLEAGWGGGLLSDRYVIEGKGSRKDAMSAAGFWFFQTTAFRDLVAWMRSYNAAAPDAFVHLSGVDYQAPHHGLEWADQVLSATQAEIDVDVRRGLWALASRYSKIWSDTNAQQQYFESSSAYVEEVLRVLPEIESNLTPLQVETLQRLPRALEQFEGRFAFSDEEPNAAGWRTQASTYRDGCMAENTTWWLDTLGKDSRIILWAHNGHVAASWQEAGWITLGEHLRKAYGDDLVTVGFSTSCGTFSAVNQEIGAFDDLTVPEPIPESYEFVFSETGIPAFFLDLRELDPGSAAGEWMGTSRPFKVMGNSPDVEDGVVTSAFGHNSTLPAMFDIVIHIEETQAIEFSN